MTDRYTVRLESVNLRFGINLGTGAQWAEGEGFSADKIPGLSKELSERFASRPHLRLKNLRDGRLGPSYKFDRDREVYESTIEKSVKAAMLMKVANCPVGVVSALQRLEVDQIDDNVTRYKTFRDILYTGFESIEEKRQYEDPEYRSEKVKMRLWSFSTGQKKTISNLDPDDEKYAENMMPHMPNMLCDEAPCGLANIYRAFSANWLSFDFLLFQDDMSALKKLNSIEAEISFSAKPVPGFGWPGGRQHHKILDFSFQEFDKLPEDPAHDVSTKHWCEENEVCLEEIVDTYLKISCEDT